MRRFWMMAVALVLGLLVLLAATIPPQFDEFTYYVPALAAVRADPPPALHEVPFPSTPLALWLQAALWDALGRGTFAARLFSLLSWIGLAALPFWRPARAGPLGRPYEYGFTVAFPFVLFAAVFSKHHVLVLLLLLIAVATHFDARRSGRGIGWASIAACVLAAGSSQFAGPLCLTLAIDAVAQGAGRRPGVLRRLSGPLLGLAVLAVFVILWGGLSPPSFADVPAFHDRETVAAVSGFRWRPQQLAVGLATLGVWATPWTGVSRRSLWIASACLIPCVYLVVRSDVLGPAWLPSASGRGPICTALRILSPPFPPIVGASLLGAAAALGAAGVVDRALRDARGRLHALYVATYLTMMMGVPYAFESYYLLMVVPALHLLSSDGATPMPRRLLRWWVPAAGVAYLLAKSAQVVAAW